MRLPSGGAGPTQPSVNQAVARGSNSRIERGTVTALARVLLHGEGGGDNCSPRFRVPFGPSRGLVARLGWRGLGFSCSVADRCRGASEWRPGAEWAGPAPRGSACRQPAERAWGFLGRPQGGVALGQRQG